MTPNQVRENQQCSGSPFLNNLSLPAFINVCRECYGKIGHRQRPRVWMHTCTHTDKPEGKYTVKIAKDCDAEENQPRATWEGVGSFREKGKDFLEDF